MMETNVIAADGPARLVNKEKRRRRILEHARKTIVKKGFDDLKLRELAISAGVTVPTIYNLIGGKPEILSIIIKEVVERLHTVQNQRNFKDVERAFEAQIEDLAALFAEDQEYYKAALIAGDRSGLFEQSSSSGIFARSLQFPIKACKVAQSEGLLIGNISAKQMGRQIYGCYRLARQDWVNGYFNLNGFRSQALTGIFLCLAADASPEFHQRLLRRLSKLPKTLR